MFKKALPFILAFMIIFTPPVLVSEAVNFSGLVPDCNTGELILKLGSDNQPLRYPDKTDPKTGKVIPGELTNEKGYANPCDFNMLMSGINKFINFVLITLATPLFALILVYVGWLYLSDRGSSENVKKAKTILKNAFFGYIIALVAWLIVKTILLSLGFTGPMYLS